MHVFLGFEPFLLSNSEKEWREVVPTPKVETHIAGTVDMAVRNRVF